MEKHLSIASRVEVKDKRQSCILTRLMKRKNQEGDIKKEKVLGCRLFCLIPSVRLRWLLFSSFRLIPCVGLRGPIPSVGLRWLLFSSFRLISNVGLRNTRFLTFGFADVFLAFVFADVFLALVFASRQRRV